MSDLAMDLTTNDLLIENGDLSIVTGDDAIIQDLQQSLQVWLGEWFLDNTVGIPFKQQILVKNPSVDLVQANFYLAAQSVPGVGEITNLGMSYDNGGRTITLNLEGTTSNGQTFTVPISVGLPTNQTIQGTVF